MRKAISVVIPTRDRSASLQRALRSLAKQTVDDEAFEVIVAGDGCRDDSVARARGMDVPYRMTVVDGEHRGRSAARNRGAARAAAPVVLFLDDDMEADPDLLAAHVRAHDGRRDYAVLGHFPLAAAPGSPDQAVRLVRTWWDRHFDGWQDPAYRFAFDDFCTGNVSISRHTFDRLGGFDESFPHDSAGEDWEFGHRLLASGGRIGHAPDARSRHHDRPTLERILRRAREEGRGHLVLAKRHPALLSRLPVGSLAAFARRIAGRKLLQAFWNGPAVAGTAAGFAGAAASVLAHTPIAALFRAAQMPAAAHAYCEGVRSAMPEWDAWMGFCMQAGGAAASRPALHAGARS
jgi:GT2 family glycosyltransferase